ERTGWVMLRNSCAPRGRGAAGRARSADRDGAPGAIRTHDLPLRRGTLYPAELRGQRVGRFSHVAPGHAKTDRPATVRGPVRGGCGAGTCPQAVYGVTTILPRISAEWPGNEQKKV